MNYYRHRFQPTARRFNPAGSEEEGDETADKTIEEAGLGQRETEPLRRRDLATHLRLPRVRLDHLAEQRTDARSSACGTATCTYTEGDSPTGLLTNQGRISVS